MRTMMVNVSSSGSQKYFRIDEAGLRLAPTTRSSVRKIFENYYNSPDDRGDWLKAASFWRVSWLWFWAQAVWPELMAPQPLWSWRQPGLRQPIADLPDP